MQMGAGFRAAAKFDEGPGKGGRGVSDGPRHDKGRGQEATLKKKATFDKVSGHLKIPLTLKISYRTKRQPKGR